MSFKTDTWENRLSSIRIDIDYGICDELWVLDWVVSCKTDFWEYRESYRIDTDQGIFGEPGVRDWDTRIGTYLKEFIGVIGAGHLLQTNSL